MLRTTTAIIVLPFVINGQSPAQDWKPAWDCRGGEALKTPWTDRVDPVKEQHGYPRPSLVREDWASLNGLWECDEARVDEDLSRPTERALSHRALVPFAVEAPLSGIGRMMPRVWYRRAFEVPAGWGPMGGLEGKRLHLHFEAVDWEATVWLNGRLLGSHVGGYDRFSFDATDALVGTGPQTLVVLAVDPTDAGTQPRGKQVVKPGGIFYRPTTGIWQSVWMEPVPGRHIRDLRVTSDADTGEVRVRFDWSAISRSSTATVEVLDGGRVVASATRAPAGADEIVLRVQNHRKWSPADPALYDLVVRIDRTFGPGTGSIDDQVRSYFGFREVAIGKDDSGKPRILLNGEPVFLVGPLDQGYWPDGGMTAPTDEALKFDVETTLALGFNCTRKHVKVEPERWYWWCDRLGLIVLQDMPSGDRSINPADADITRTPQSVEVYERELREMIAEHGHHPSIVMWVPFNEGWGQFETARIVDLVRSLDPTRLVDNASGWTDRGVGDVNDIHVYPGPAMPKLETGRAAMVGEFGGIGLAAPGHTWVKETWGYRGAADAEDLAFQYENLMREAFRLRDEGLCCAIYTQLTDVETECNGLLTYDRQVVKADRRRLTNASAGRVPAIVPLVGHAALGEQGAKWWYTLDKPAAGWESVEFSDSAWSVGEAGFGTRGTPGAVIGTEWGGTDIWLRREVELQRVPEGEPVLLMHHDEDAEVYINGILAATAKGYTTTYTPVRMSPEARAALRAGTNVIAVHCRQTSGGQYIDVGLAERVLPGPE